MQIRFRSYKLGALLLLAWGTATADALVTATDNQVNNGYEYSYSVTNNGSASVFSFALALEDTVSAVDSPTGWTGGVAGVKGAYLIFWLANNQADEITQGMTLSGFSFFSPDPPGTVDFNTLDDNFVEFDGTTIGPVPVSVPEPQYFALLVLVSTISLVFASATRHRRNRKRVNSRAEA